MTNVRAFYGWKLIAVLSAAVAVNLGTAYVGAGVVNSAMARDLHLSRGILGLGSTILVLVMGLASPIAARIVNAVGARITLCAGSLMTALGSLLLALWVNSAWQYVIVYGGIVGIGASFGALIPAQACTSMWFQNKRGLAMSLVLAGSGLGGSISAPLLTRAIAWADGNWRVAWYFVLGAALLVGLAALLFVRNRPADYGQQPDGADPASNLPQTRTSKKMASVYRSDESWTVREAARTPAFWLIGLAAVGESIPSTAAVVHAVPHLRDLGHSAAAAGAALGLFSICTIFGKLSAGYLCDRAEPRYAWSASIMLMGCAVYVATHAQSTPVMYLFVIMLGLGSGAALTCWHATVANYFGATLFASVLGAQMPFSNAAAAATPFLVGLAYDAQHSYNAAFYVVAVLSVGAAVPLLAAAPPRRKGDTVMPYPIRDSAQQ